MPQCKIKILALSKGSAIANALVAPYHLRCVRSMIHRLGAHFGGEIDSVVCTGELHRVVVEMRMLFRTKTFPWFQYCARYRVGNISHREPCAKQNGVCALRPHGRLGWPHIPGAKRTQRFPDFPQFRCSPFATVFSRKYQNEVAPHRRPHTTESVRHITSEASRRSKATGRSAREYFVE